MTMKPNGRVDASRSHCNILVWLERTPYPHSIPAWVRCTRDIGVFRRARSRWFNAHPQFTDPYLDRAKDPAGRYWKAHRSALTYEGIAKNSCTEAL